MSKQPLSHFSPVFANRPWANEKSELLCYYRNAFRGTVEKEPKGAKQWARQRGLYSWKIERELTEALESDAARVYASLLQLSTLGEPERRIWAQFLMSQLVRTPTFMRYEKAVRRAFNIDHAPDHDRVGCPHCMDLAYVTSREWLLFRAHEDDYFIRSDNAVLLTGFVGRPQTRLYYPISPRLCFVANSMDKKWSPRHPKDAPEILGRCLEKGDALMINFYLARAAEQSIVLSPQDDGKIAEQMFGDILGTYPQPPFSLHAPQPHEIPDAFASVRKIMTRVDKVQYPSWLPCELESNVELDSHSEEQDA